MAWAALGRVSMGAVKGKVKQIAADKLLNRKKKTSKRRASAQKIMGGGEKNESNQSERGGALAVIPKSPLVASPGGELAKIPEKPQEDVVYTIRTRVIEIDKLLKGTLAVEKAQQKKERQQKENEKRKQKEEKLEKPDKDGDEETPKKLIPKIGFLERIKQFITKVLLGWIAFKLIKFLPQIIKFLKPIAAIAGFLIDFAGKLLNGLVTFVDWGYKALDATKGWIGDKFGDGAAQKFESFMGNLTKMFNGIVLLGMGIAKLAGMRKGPKGPKGPKGQKPKPKPKPRWQKALQRRWKNSRVGKFFRNNAAARKKLLRKITKPVSKAVRALRPKNIVENLKKTEIGKKVTQRFAKVSQQVDDIIKDPKKALDKLKKTDIGKRVTKTTQKISEAIKDPKKTLQQLQKTQVGKKVTEIAKKVDPRKWKMPQIKTPGWMKKVGGAIKQGFANADAWIKSIPAKRKALFDGIGKKIGPFIDEIGEGIGEIGKKIGAELDKLKNLKPQAAIDKLMAKVKPSIDNILNKNPVIKKLVTGLKPKNAKGAIQGLLTKAASNPALQKLIKTLKANKGASKGLGPIDKIITALMALWDYNKGGESPINAIVKGLAGLLGWAAGFSAATAVPVLGQSGIFNFMGGMAGSFIGDEIGKVLLRGLAKTPLADIEDPIMGGKDIEEGRPARKLVRDPDSIIGDTEKKDPTVGGEGSKEGTKEGDGENVTAKGNKENIVPLDVDAVSKKADDISMNTSYQEGGGETVVVPSRSQTSNNGDSSQSSKNLVTVAAGTGGESDEMSDALYMGG